MSILYPQVFILVLFLFWLEKRSQKTAWLLRLSLVFMILALSRPVLTNVTEETSLAGKEFIIAIDVSYSMRATDIAPSRLERAKAIVRQILKDNPHARFALYAFTTNPLILSPSTRDQQLLRNALDSLQVNNILTHGTSLQALFDHISKLKMPEKNLILLSDGGEEREVDTLGLNLFSVGLASEKGAVLKDPYGKTLKNDKGNLLISTLNPLLKKISTHYFPASTSTFDFGTIPQEQFSTKDKQASYDIFWVPLLIALILFLAHYIKVPKRFLALIPFLTLNAEAGLLDWYYIHQASSHYHDKAYKEAANYYQKIEHKTMQSQMNLASCYYQAGAYAKARSLYSALHSHNPQIKKKLLFKLGNCAVKEEDYESARAYYRDALVFGKDEDILYNLKQIAHKKTDSHAPKAKGEDKMKMKADTQAQSAKNKKEAEGGNAPKAASHPLGYKAYDLINKGYINEKKPW